MRNSGNKVQLVRWSYS